MGKARGWSCASAPTRPTSPSPAESTAASSGPARKGSRAGSRSARTPCWSSPATPPASATARRRSSASRSSRSAERLALRLGRASSHNPVAGKEQGGEDRGGAEDEWVGEAEAFEPGAEVDRDRGDRQVADG